jgi:hypothetical protein
MKINFKMSGGFAHLPAFSRPFIIDTQHVDAQVADQLESLVRQSRFFEQPARASTVAKGAADYQTYTITVEDGTHTHTIQLTDPIKDENLQKLVSNFRMMARPSTS